MFSSIGAFAGIVKDVLAKVEVGREVVCYNLSGREIRSGKGYHRAEEDQTERAMVDEESEFFIGLEKEGAMKR